MKASLSGHCLQDIFATMQASQLSATRINVMNMKGLTNVFDISGAGSMAKLDNVTISNIVLSTASPPPRWTGVNVRDMAMASVTGLSVSDSSNVRHVVSAQRSAMVNIENVIIMDLVGGRQVVRYFL
jgi:hypothetical protein